MLLSRRSKQETLRDCEPDAPGKGRGFFFQSISPDTLATKIHLPHPASSLAPGEGGQEGDASGGGVGKNQGAGRGGSFKHQMTTFLEGTG